ncbi:MAG: transglutaminase-like domain-containing protein [Muribaculaceae bacterium]|nr:transglutaminase-like domain-containing protein [Muribaculaceae bacterium]
MQRVIPFLLILLTSVATILGESVTIKAPSNLFNQPIRDGYPLFPDSLVFDKDAEEIIIPDVGAIGNLGDYGFNNIRKVTVGNADYLPSCFLANMPNLEEVVFDGLIGHFDCIFIMDCPKLKKVVFNGPISSCGSSNFFYNCPNLEDVEVNSVGAIFALKLYEDVGCPKLKKVAGNGAFLEVEDSLLTPKAGLDVFRKNKRLTSDLERLAKWQSEVLRAKDNGWMRKCIYEDANVVLPYLDGLKSNMADTLKSAMQYAWNLGDDVKSKLDLLKESPAYSREDKPTIRFTYAAPTDSLLTLSREVFNLDSIAGTGDDISKIKNLLYWVHDNIRHDGGNGLAPGARNLRNTYQQAKANNCGYNCRALAISLAEALLAEGIPARYVTCMSKDYENDQDCHVICVAWSKSLNKWIWVDPTFAGYVADENGLLLHPGEVRYRLQHDLPVVLNSDANWNNKFEQTAEHYLYDYMAKNLYILESNSINQAEPEGKTSHAKGVSVALVPEGFKYKWGKVVTSNDEWFWQAPE